MNIYRPIIILLFLIGCQKSNTPPAPSVMGIDPDKGSEGLFVYISGAHFDTVANNNQVSFNGINAPVHDIFGDSILVVQVPAGVSTGKITVTSHDQKTTSQNDFVILPGSWRRKKDFPDPSGRFVAIGFSIGNKGYVGFGGHDGNPLDDLYMYDPSTDTWAQQASPGIPMMYGVAVVVGNKAYMGIGKTNTGDTNKFFEYDPVTNTYSAKADFPGEKREGTLGFNIGNKVYVGMGSFPNVYKDLWQYDPSTNLWTRKADWPAPVSDADFVYGFSLNDSTAYMGSGRQSDRQGNWWLYNANTDSWIQKNNLPFAINYGPSVMVIDGNGYLINGWNENWLYNPSTDQWIQKAFFTDRGFGASFVIGSKGYFGLGAGVQLPHENHYINSDFWEFTP
jgi:IPT/TIG domain/Kelch motif